MKNCITCVYGKDIYFLYVQLIVVCRVLDIHDFFFVMDKALRACRWEFKEKQEFKIRFPLGSNFKKLFFELVSEVDLGITKGKKE